MRGPTQLLKDTYNTLSKKPFLFMGISFAPALVSLIAIAFPLVSTIFLAEMRNANLITGLTVMFFTVYFIFGSAIQGWSQAAFVWAIRNDSQDIDVLDAYKHTTRKILPMAVTTLISYLAIYGGMLFLVIPALLLMFWFSLSTLITASEDISSINALLKSKYYIKGHGFAVLGRFLVIILILYLITFAISFGLIFIDIPESLAIIKQLVLSFISVLLAPIMTTYMYLMLEDLRQLKQGEFIPSKFGKFVVITLSLITSVIIILSILIFGILGVFNPAEQLKKSQIIAQDSSIRTLQLGLKNYKLDKGKYPDKLEDLVPTYTHPLSPGYVTKETTLYSPSTNRDAYELCVPATTSLPRKCVNSDNPLLP